jgi:hypothetical protein
LRSFIKRLFSPLTCRLNWWHHGFYIFRRPSLLSSHETYFRSGSYHHFTLQYWKGNGRFRGTWYGILLLFFFFKFSFVYFFKRKKLIKLFSLKVHFWQRLLSS